MSGDAENDLGDPFDDDRKPKEFDFELSGLNLTAVKIKANPKKLDFLKDQFKLKHFLLDYEQPSFLGMPQCGAFQRVYILYRVLSCLVWISMAVAITVSRGPVLWFIYLTRWSFIVLVISTHLQLFSAIYLFKNFKNKTVDRQPALFSINWIFYTISCVSTMLVTTMYWAVVYAGEELMYVDIVVHGVNAIYLLVDFFITGVPVRVLHFYMTVLYGMLYCFFCVFHCSLGGEPIYPVLDWMASPEKALAYSLGLVLFAVPFFHILLFGLYWLRILLYKVVCRCGVVRASEKYVIPQIQVHSVSMENGIYKEKAQIPIKNNIEEDTY